MNLKKIPQYFLILFIILNILSYLIIYYKTGTNVYSKGYLEKKKSFFIADPVTNYVHPFFGFIDLNNVVYENNLISDEKLFYSIFESPNKKYNGTIKILLIGGSVAINFTDNSKNSYGFNQDINNFDSRDLLARKISSYFPDKKIIFYNAAIKSGKQPQQLFKLYYLSLIGMQFDIVINFDGFQEMAQPFVKNVPIKDELIYPRRYSDEVAGQAQDISCIKITNKESQFNTYVPVLEIFSYYKIRNCFRELRRSDGINLNWKKFFPVKEKNLEDSAKISYEIWKKSSIEIENFSKFKKFFYLHVIAPSQHLKDSKNFSEEEKKEFLDYEYGPIISEYYKKLINFDNFKLKHSLNLQYVFKNENSTVYRDACCRYNNYGMNIISEKIAKYLSDNYSK